MLRPTHKPSGTSTTNSFSQWPLCFVVVGGAFVLSVVSADNDASVENNADEAYMYVAAAACLVA